MKLSRRVGKRQSMLVLNEIGLFRNVNSVAKNLTELGNKVLLNCWIPRRACATSGYIHNDDIANHSRPDKKTTPITLRITPDSIGDTRSNRSIQH